MSSSFVDYCFLLCKRKVNSSILSFKETKGRSQSPFLARANSKPSKQDPWSLPGFERQGGRTPKKWRNGPMGNDAVCTWHYESQRWWSNLFTTSDVCLPEGRIWPWTETKDERERQTPNGGQRRGWRVNRGLGLSAEDFCLYPTHGSTGNQLSVFSKEYH